MAASILSNPQRIQFQDNVGIELIWTGTPTGSFTVEISIDYDPERHIAGNWVNLPLSPSIGAVGTPDVAYIDLNQLSAPYIRVRFTRTAGTGTLDCYVAAKGV